MAVSALEHNPPQVLQKAVDELKADGVKFTLEVTKISPTLTISFVQAPDNLRMELSEGGR